MDTLDSYDQLPYDSLPLPETQPDFLAAVARLHGFDAADPGRARILELGCAQGGNLIPLAWRWPQCECVGVELSRVQAQGGADFVRGLGLPNVHILHGDLAALPSDLGEFDYIIAHGVFSWVPPAVQAALLDVCRRHLTPRGVAYVSFNVAAGWAQLLPLRAALLEGTDASLSAPERYRQALEVLAALERDTTDALLRKEIAYLKTASPSYLFHEYLADFNAPVTFAAFSAQLEGHGLRYIGEAGPRAAVVELEGAWGLSPEGMTGRWQDAEAALDDALRTRFRRALIARAEAPCAAPPNAQALQSLMFYADLQSEADLDLETATLQDFVNPAGNIFPIAEPAMKAAVMILSMAYPRALPYSELLAAARQLLGDLGHETAVDEASFSEALFRLVVAHAVMPSVWAGNIAETPSSHPRAHVLARALAASPGWVVTGARHVALDLDPPARALLTALDGSRDVQAVSLWMQHRLTQEGLDLPREQVEALVDRQLWLFARHGLLA